MQGLVCTQQLLHGMKSQRDSIVQIHCGIPPSRRHLESESPAASGIPLEKKPPRGLTTIQQEFVQIFLFFGGFWRVVHPLPTLICKNARLDVPVEEGDKVTFPEISLILAARHYTVCSENTADV